MIAAESVPPEPPAVAVAAAAVAAAAAEEVLRSILRADSSVGLGEACSGRRGAAAAALDGTCCGVLLPETLSSALSWRGMSRRRRG